MWPMSLIRGLRDRGVRQLRRWLKIAELLEQEQQLRDLASRFRACGDHLSLCWPIRLSGAESMTVGRNVHIGENAFIRAEGGLTIGDNTRISRNLVLYTVNHRHEGNVLPFDDGSIRKPVVIGRNVWIGMNVCVTPGTVIGDGVIVGMGTTVSGEVPPLAIIAGQKWRVIGQRNEEHYRELDAAKRYGNIFGKPLEMSSEFRGWDGL
jgi:acetyltransferase-like isoleucine patch superfamily enzyme